MIRAQVQYGSGAQSSSLAQSQLQIVKWSQWKKCWNKLLEIMSLQGEFDGHRLTKRVKSDDSTIECKPVAIFPMENVHFSGLFSFVIFIDFFPKWRRRLLKFSFTKTSQIRIFWTRFAVYFA